MRVIRWTRTASAAIGAATVALAGWQVSLPTALADPDPQPQVETPAPEQEVLHNVVYRARVDGVSRGATITYRAEDDRLEVAEPTMIPGRVFEANTVLPASEIANVRVSIDWPYSANLHCEILVDNALVAQADDFVGPRVTPQRDDPNFGTLTCQVPVSGIADCIPVDPAAAPTGGQPPLDPGLPVEAAFPPA